MVYHHFLHSNFGHYSVESPMCFQHINVPSSKLTTESGRSPWGHPVGNDLQMVDVIIHVLGEIIGRLITSRIYVDIVWLKPLIYH